MARVRYTLNPLTGLIDALQVVPPDYITSVSDSPTIDLDVTGGILTANLISLTGFDTDDLAEGSNLYFTTERAQDAVGASLVDTATVDLVYDDALNQISANVIASAIDHGSLAGLLDDDHPQYHTDARALTWLGTRSTTDLPEGTNLYFTTARARLSISGAPGSPVLYNNTTGEIDLSVMPISYGGTGQSNAQAAINNLSNSASTAVDGDVFQWLAGNAQFAPLVIPALTGTPNTLAYYNSSGDLINYNYWQAQDDGRVSGSFNYTGSGQAILSLNPQLQFGDTWDSLYLLSGTLSNAGTATGYNSLLSLNFNDAGGTTEILNGLNIGTQGNTTGNKQYATFYSNGTVGGNLSGIYINSLDDVINNTNLISISSGGSTGGQLNVANWGNQGNVGDSLRFLDWDNSGTVGNYLSGLYLSSRGVVTKGLDFLSLNVTADVGDSTGTNINGLTVNIQNSATIYGGIYGVGVNNSAPIIGNYDLQGGSLNNQSSGTGYRFAGWSSYNQADMSEEIRGYTHNSVGDSRTSTGLDIYMEGNATDDAQGIRLNVTNQTSTNQRVKSLDINGATYSFNNVYEPKSNLFVDSGNNIFTEYRIPAGSPLTNTDAFINGNIVALLAQDDVAIGPVGLGQMHSAAISLVAVADTKTVDLHRGHITGISVQNPGFADNGTLTEYQGYVYIGVLPGGGNTAITTATGLIMTAGFDSYATNNWGLRVQGTTAENYVNKLAVGTASETAAAGLLHDVNGQLGITDIGSGISIAEGSDAKMGLATLVAGTVTVSNTSVTANSRIFLTNNAPSLLIGTLAVTNIVPGVSFDITSTELTETSSVAWLIIEAI